MKQMSLEAARIDAGYTQAEAAEALGISTAVIFNWENGLSYPKTIDIPKIEELYGRTYAEIDFLRPTMRRTRKSST